MDQHIVQLLQNTTNSNDTRRRGAEDQLQELYHNAEFAPVLCTIAASDQAALSVRQSALLVLKNAVLAGWSDSLDEFRGEFLFNQSSKEHVRVSLLNIAISESAAPKIQNAASLVVSTIASVDYPDEWPDILQKLLQNISQAGPNSLHGSLKVLSELVEDGFDQEQFFAIAQDLANVLHQVAVSEAALSSRALAVQVFRGCFDILEMVLEDHKTAVKQFAEQVVGEWMPFLLHISQTRLPQRPEEVKGDSPYSGLVKLKTQVMKTLMRIRILFPSLVSPQAQALFQATWDDLSHIRDSFQMVYVHNDTESRLEDADGMPYTLDFLALEELDFLRAIIGSPTVRKALEARLRDQSQGNWLVDLLDVVVPFSQITTEEEGMWDIDVNVFIAEETSVTANYTARTACGDLATKIGEWLPDSLLQAILTYMSHLFNSDSEWRRKEAVLCILNRVLDDWSGLQKKLDEATTAGILEYAKFAMASATTESPFLQARGFLLAGVLTATSTKTFHPTAASLLEATVQMITRSDSQIVQVSCIRALGSYLTTLPTSSKQPQQAAIIAALSSFLSTRDTTELTESDDLILSLLEALRDALTIDVRVCITGDGLNLLFQIASTLSAGFTVIGSVNEAFEEICGKVKRLGPTEYSQFSSKVVPNLLGAFNVGSMTEQENLLTLAADMLSTLTEQANSASLPPELVPTILPKVLPLLLTSEEPDVLKPCTASLRHILEQAPSILLQWHDPATSGPTAGKSGLECVLLVIDRLLGSSIDEYAAVEVGYLASALVTAAGSTEQLSPYLAQLLQAIALRLESATKASLIQSLILVFARLSLTAAKDVLDFLAQISINGTNGLHIVLPKWLENSSDFSGYEDIRTNVVALARLYELHDPRLEQISCKGELIVEKSDRIMTRSRARNMPQRWTQVSVPVKIVKLLVEELGAQMATSTSAGLGIEAALNGAAGGSTNGGGAGAADDDDDDDLEDDDGEWEDEPGAGVLDLGLPGVKEHLMGLGGLGGEESEFRVRQPDDETQNFLVQWFKVRAGEQGFAVVYEGLNEEEKGKLATLR